MRVFARLFLLSFLFLTGCSRGIDNDRLRVDIIEDSPGLLAIGRLPLRQSAAYLRAATAQGLVRFDAEGNIVPALAARWIVTDDELGYIFRLGNMEWNNRRVVTSEDVARTFNTRLRELRGSRFAADIATIDKAVSMTGKVIEIRLKTPMPNLLEMLAQPEFGLVYQGAGAGPMKAQKFDNYLLLRRKYMDEHGTTDLEDSRLTMRVSNPAMAFARYNAGATDIILGGRFQHLPIFEAAAPRDGSLQFDPVPGLFGLIFVEAGPFLSHIPNREAIAMAIDRPKLLTSFDILAWQESFTLMPESMTNRAPVPRPNWAGLRMEERRALARRIIEVWIAENGDVRPLRIAMPTGPGARIFFAQIRSDLAAIGLRVERVTPNQNTDLRLVDRVADMSTPLWYLEQLSCRATKVCNRSVDELVETARRTADRDERIRLLGDAELMLQADRNFIPIANPLRWSYSHAGLKGFQPNARGWHWLQYLGRDEN